MAVHCSERHCSIRRTESFEHVSKIVWVRHIHSCRHERCNRHGRSDMEGVKMLNCLGLSDMINAMRFGTITHQVGRKCKIRGSPRRSHQSNGALENYQKQLQGQVRTMLAAFQERTQYRYRPTTDSALRKWIVRHAAWLFDYATCNLSSLSIFDNFELWSIVCTTLSSVPFFLVFPRPRLERQL